jgi:hypothetical protein
MPLPLLAMAGIQAIPAVAGFIGNLFDRKRRKREEGKASAGISNLADIYKQQLGQDYFDSAEGMGAMKEIDENSNDYMDQINAMSNVNGLTDEAKIAMMGQNMKAKQGAYSGLAQNSNLWRQRNLQNYGGALGSLFQVGMNNRNNTNNSLNNIVGGMQMGIDGAMNAGVFDMIGKAKGGPAIGGQMSGMGSGLGNAVSMINKMKG